MDTASILAVPGCASFPLALIRGASGQGLLFLWVLSYQPAPPGGQNCPAIHWRNEHRTHPVTQSILTLLNAVGHKEDPRVP